MYTEQQLVSFGKYLLSSERTMNIMKNPDLGDFPERISDVYDADLANWKDKEGISRSFKFGEEPQAKN